jgi:acetyltransferase-like isoleucine patch superfamily enzyme
MIIIKYLKKITYTLLKYYFDYEGKKNRLKIFYYKTKFGQAFSLGYGFYFGKYSSIHIEASNAKLIIGNDVYFRKFCSILLLPNSRLIIGDKVFFNNYCSLNCLGKIVIGENTLFGEGVKLYDHNHHFRDTNLPIRDQGFSIGNIEIGKNCWIGSNVVILNNVTIGDNVVIGANNIIYKSIPSNCIVKAHSEQIITFQHL